MNALAACSWTAWREERRTYASEVCWAIEISLAFEAVVAVIGMAIVLFQLVLSPEVDVALLTHPVVVGLFLVFLQFVVVEEFVTSLAGHMAPRITFVLLKSMAIDERPAADFTLFRSPGLTVRL